MCIGRKICMLSRVFSHNDSPTGRFAFRVSGRELVSKTEVGPLTRMSGVLPLHVPS